MPSNKEIQKRTRDYDIVKTRFDTYKSKCEQIEVTDSRQFRKLLLYLESVQSILNEYKSSASEFLTCQIIDNVIDFELECINLISDIQEKLHENARFNSDLRCSPTPEHNSSSSSEHSHSNLNMRLPELTLPKFDGDIKAWQQFADVFQSMITKNSSIDDVTKLHYLLSCVTGEAKSVIQDLPLISQNFKVAWDLLQKRYDNVRLVVASHIQALFSAPIANDNSSSELTALIDLFNSTLKTLEAMTLNVPIQDLIMSQLLCEKLGPEALVEWEKQAPLDHVPTFQELIEFLERRRKIVGHTSHLNTTKSNSSSVTNNVKPKQNLNNSKSKQSNSCPYCRDSHSIFHCREFIKLTPQQRFTQITSRKLCRNCLKPFSVSHVCTAGSCTKCQRKHHTLLCDAYAAYAQNRATGTPRTCNTLKSTLPSASTFFADEGQSQIILNSQQGPNIPTAPSDCSISSISSLKMPEPQANSTRTALHASPHVNDSSCLLSTAQVKITLKDGRSFLARALLDSGSDANLVSQNLIDKLGIKTMPSSTTIKCLSNVEVFSTTKVNLSINSIYQDWQSDIAAIVVPALTSNLPSVDLRLDNLPSFANIKLADPFFSQSKPIDMILGASIFFSIMTPGEIPLGYQLPVLKNTVLGWIVGGQLPDNVFPKNKRPSKHVSFSAFMQTTNVDAQQQLETFWQLESIPIQTPRTAEERFTENHFQENVDRSSEGRFVVRLPRKSPEVRLGESRDQALKRFYSLERRLERDPVLKSQYVAFMEEYIDLKHMSEVSDKKETMKEEYFIPHHPVFKPSSTTTKLRVVFDASAITTNGVSLNDILTIGPVIQPDLFTQVLTFRTFPIAFTADITKMYRQVLVHPDDRHLQRIFWRSSQDIPVKIFQLNTVTYGTTPASFLAVRSLHKLVEDDGQPYPIASQMLTQNLYVDDLLAGCNTYDEAKSAFNELTQLTQKGGFQFRKWSSNSIDFMQSIPQDLRESQTKIEVESSFKTGVQTLGLLWDTSLDTLYIQSHSNMSQNPINFTKRSLLSCIASIFDPLGLLSPVTISCKILFQKVWRYKLEWDDTLPAPLNHEWLDIFNSLHFISQIVIPRYVGNIKMDESVQIHGFSDASEVAYGACMYVRSVDSNNHFSSHLLTAKSKVAPNKRITIPRLELCGALLLSNLIHKVITIFNFNPKNVYLWTDSTIVLSWLKSSSRDYKPFVSNRIGEIQHLTQSCNWRHVPSQDNPADLISRGLHPQQIVDSQKWWHGPSWLSNAPSFWPAPKTCSSNPPEETRIALTVAVTPLHLPVVNIFSSYQKTIRVMAYVLRFVFNSRNPKVKRNGVLQIEELRQAETKCILVIQSQCFAQEVTATRLKEPISSKSNLLSLNPMMDNDGLLRVGGRLANSNLPYDAKHQIILPTGHPFTKALITSTHRELLHSGPQGVIAQLRLKFWIPSIRKAVRSVIHSCVICVRHKSSNFQQIMGDLPAARAVESFAFQNTACDLCGPYLLRLGAPKSKMRTKSYIALFVCLSTKAIHCEIVADLSAPAFLRAFSRFCARRGIPNHMYSDNASNFKRVAKDLRELYEFLSSQQIQNKIQTVTSLKGVQWHFIPPRSPHFGGLHEANIKALKFHLKRVMNTQTFNFEEFTTLVNQVEAILNSRPLVSLTSDPTDFHYLSPGHFLIGRPLVAMPSNVVSQNVEKCVTKWNKIQVILKQLWKKWSRDYLTSMQVRQKWRHAQPNVTIGAVVLISDDNVSPTYWPMGTIIATYPGKDSKIRVVDVQTSSGILRRPLVKLCPLPVQ